MRLEGKVAIVTGAGRGLGRAVALRLAREGAAVAVADINAAEAADTAHAGAQLGCQCLAIPTDVSDPAQAAGLVHGAVAASAGSTSW